MAKENFQQALRWVLQHEGFFVDHPKDPGGATNRGITQRTYDAFRRSRGETPRDVRAIEEAEVRQIYREQYADAVWFDRLPSGLDYALFDFAVNSGPARAVKALQGIVGVRADGIMGNRTLAAVKAHDSGQVITLLCDARQRFVRSLRTYKTFGKGWERRIAEVRHKGLALAKGQAPGDDNLSETPKADGAQSLTASIGASRRSKGAVAGVAGTALAAIPEAMEMARPAQELADFARYAGLVGLLIVACALGYIIWVRCHAVKD